MTHSEVGKIIRKVKTNAGIAPRCVTPRIVEETIGSEIAIDYVDPKDIIKTPIRDMGKRALSNIVEQGVVDTILMGTMERLENSTCFMNSQMCCEASSTSTIMPIAAVVEDSVNNVLEEICFENALERRLSRLGTAIISPLLFISMSSRFRRRVSGPLEQSISNDLDVKKIKDDKRKTEEVAKWCHVTELRLL